MSLLLFFAVVVFCHTAKAFGGGNNIHSSTNNGDPTFKIVENNRIGKARKPMKKSNDSWQEKRRKFFEKHEPSKYSYRSGKSEKEFLKLLQATQIAINVLDFNASNDGRQDCSFAFANAMNYASSIGGAVVYAPSGTYLFEKAITIPPGVTLMGSYIIVPSHKMVKTPDTIPSDGTVFLIDYGANLDAMNTSGAMITITANALLKGVCIYYLRQLCNGSVPTPYGPTVYMNGADSSIMDVECLNCYVFVMAIAADRHIILRLQGQPLLIGIYIDEIYDIGRIEDIHFNPWFCHDSAYIDIQSLYGRSFVFGRSDWEYVFNTFSFSYAIGYHFIETEAGSTNGNFLGLGADSANNASVKVDASQPPGLLLTNCEFTAFYDSGFAPVSSAVPTQILVSSTNTGPVILNGCSFWGPTNSIATLHSQGTTIFNSCVFVEWDLFDQGSGAPAIYTDGGSLTVQSSLFMQSVGVQLYANSYAEKVIFSDNILEGALNVSIASGVAIAISNNL